MRIFGLDIKRVESDNRGRTYRGQTFGFGGEMPASTFETFYKYYRKNSDIRRCVQELQQNVASGGYYYTMGDQPLDKFPVFDDVLNAEQPFDSFKKRFIRDSEIAGNVYIKKLRNAFGHILGYQFLDPRTIAIVADEYGIIKKYIQKVKGHIEDIPVEDIYHYVNERDPDNEIFGLSTMEGLVVDVLADYEAGLSNYYFFKNNAIPSQLIVLDENMSEEEQKHAIEKLKENFKGGKNKHKISVTSGIKDIKKLQADIEDMEFQVMRGFTTNKVCAAFGVPKVILNYTDGVNYTNADIQYTKFIENTIRPREAQLTHAINDLLHEIDDRVDFNIVDEHIDDQKERTETLIRQITYGMKTINEAREEIGLHTYEGVDIANEPLITRTLTKLEDAGLDSLTVNQFEE